MWEGGGEKKTKKALNMLLPWGCTAACDLEKQCRVMGILNKKRKEGGGRRKKHAKKKKRGTK